MTTFISISLEDAVFLDFIFKKQQSVLTIAFRAFIHNISKVDL